MNVLLHFVGVGNFALGGVTNVAILVDDVDAVAQVNLALVKIIKQLLLSLAFVGVRVCESHAVRGMAADAENDFASEGELQALSCKQFPKACAATETHNLRSVNGKLSNQEAFRLVTNHGYAAFSFSFSVLQCDPMRVSFLVSPHDGPAFPSIGMDGRPGKRGAVITASM